MLDQVDLLYFSLAVVFVQLQEGGSHKTANQQQHPIVSFDSKQTITPTNKAQVQETMMTMKATQCSAFGKIDQVMTVEDPVPVPQLTDEYVAVEPIHPVIQSATRKDRKTHMIIKTLAVALAPGDLRVLSGKTRELQGPPSFPYIPGADCCGIVMEIQPDEPYFKKGDRVAVRFSNAPRDALAEYARVSSTVCEKMAVTQNLSPLAAAALASASPAVQLAEYVQPNERILVLGAGGGIGSHFVQLARPKVGEGGYICGTSSTPERLLKAPLNYDKAIDYTKEDIFESKEFQEQPFDAIFDLACGGWLKLKEQSAKGIPSIVKPASQGGRFITPTSDTPSVEVHSLGQAMGYFMIKPLLRSIWSRIGFTRSRLPVFINASDCLPNNREIISRTLQLAYEKKLEAVVDGPYPMTTEGVREAFGIAESRHGKGKVVIQVAEA